MGTDWNIKCDNQICVSQSYSVAIAVCYIGYSAENNILTVQTRKMDSDYPDLEDNILSDASAVTISIIQTISQRF